MLHPGSEISHGFRAIVEKAWARDQLVRQQDRWGGGVPAMAGVSLSVEPLEWISCKDFLLLRGLQRTVGYMVTCNKKPALALARKEKEIVNGFFIESDV
jgi:hypothetical protein